MQGAAIHKSPGVQQNLSLATIEDADSSHRGPNFMVPLHVPRLRAMGSWL